MRRLLAASVFCLVSHVAVADVLVSEFTLGNPFSNGSVSASITYAPAGGEGRSLSANAGQFSIKVDSAISPLLVFCVDIFHNLSLPSNYTQTALTTLTSARLSQLNALLSHASDVVLDANTSGGMLLAVWEVLYEDVLTGLNVNAGEFKTTSAANATANLYLSYLAGTWTADKNGTLTGSVQHLVPVSPSHSQELAFYEGTGSSTVSVPEPASMALLGMGLVGLGLTRRRTIRG